jgi:hypothetical protein
VAARRKVDATAVLDPQAGPETEKTVVHERVAHGDRSSAGSILKLPTRRAANMRRNSTTTVKRPARWHRHRPTDHHIRGPDMTSATPNMDALASAPLKTRGCWSACLAGHREGLGANLAVSSCSTIPTWSGWEMPATSHPADDLEARIAQSLAANRPPVRWNSPASKPGLK